MHTDCQKEGKVPNCILRWTENGWEIEADPRHAELVVEPLGLTDEKADNTPVISDSKEEDTEEDIELEGENVARYRGVAARCTYPAIDRPDCVFAIMDGCREISKPIAGFVRRLMRVGRYVKTCPRVAWRYNMQSEQGEIAVRTVAD